jgi:hypothetical protein
MKDKTEQIVFLMHKLMLDPLDKFVVIKTNKEAYVIITDYFLSTKQDEYLEKKIREYLNLTVDICGFEYWMRHGEYAFTGFKSSMSNPDITAQISGRHPIHIGLNMVFQQIMQF